MNVNINAVKDIVIVIVVFFLIKNAFPSILIEGGSGLGLVVFIICIIEIYKLKKVESEYKEIFLSILVSLISLIFWSNLFTIRKIPVIGRETTYWYPSFIWAINSGIYVYFRLKNKNLFDLKKEEILNESTSDINKQV